MNHCKDLQRTVDNIKVGLAAKDAEISNWKLAGNQPVVQKLLGERTEIQGRLDNCQARLDDCLTNELNQ